MEITPSKYPQINAEEFKLMGLDALKIAEEIMSGKADPQLGHDIHITTNYHMMDNVYRALPIPMADAVRACDDALYEAYCYYAYKNDWKTRDPHWNHMSLYITNKTDNGEECVRVTGEQLTNLFWMTSGGHDASTSALFAFAYDPKSNHIDPQNSLKYWGWWLTEAIQQAWDLASETHS